MTAEQITGRDNSLLRHLSGLARDGRRRQEHGEFLCEGEKLLWEALDAKIPVRAVVFEENEWEKLRAGCPAAVRRLEESAARVVYVPAALFRTVSTLEHHLGAVFSCAIPERQDFPQRPGCYIALDGLQDPGNVGTVVRTADAFALGGVFLLPGCADLYNPKTLRATMGSVFRVPVWKTDADVFFAGMRAARTPVYAAALHARARPLDGVPLSPAAVVIGSEGAGVSGAVLERCAFPVILPMPGRAESLNAAVAAAILMWEMSKACR